MSAGSWLEFCVISVLAACGRVIDAENVVWKTVFFVHVSVVFAAALYTSLVVVQLMSQQMMNPLRYEEGRYVIRFITSENTSK